MLSDFNVTSQLKFAVMNFRRIYEDNRSLPKDADLKSKFNICNPKINTIFISDVFIVGLDPLA